jgi:hypothetical protein
MMMMMMMTIIITAAAAVLPPPLLLVWRWVEWATSLLQNSLRIGLERNTVSAHEKDALF